MDDQLRGSVGAEASGSSRAIDSRIALDCSSPVNAIGLVIIDSLVE